MVRVIKPNAKSS
jgi:hypothetical protein